MRPDTAAIFSWPLRSSVVVFQQTIRPPSSPGGAGDEPASGGSSSTPNPPNIPLILGIVAVIGGALICACLSGVLVWVLAGGQLPFRLGPTAQAPTPVVTLALAATAQSTSEAIPTALASQEVMPTANAEAAARAFIGEFSNAQEQKDVDYLMNHLGQATLDRYGQDQCRAYLEAHAGTTTAIKAVSTSYPETFEYTTDGMTTTIPDTVKVDIQLLALGTPTTSSMHVLIKDGQAYWFTDCGEPLP